MAHKILLADDHAIVREGLRSLILKVNSLEVIGEAGDGIEAIKMAKEIKPDLIIMDILMPNLNGIEATKQIKKQNPQIKVIIVSAHSTRKFVSEAIKAGANGYVPKECCFEELKKAINVVRENKNYISPEIASILISDYIEHSTYDSGLGISTLNNRQRQVLQMLAEGKTTKEIADILNLSSKTVDAIRRHIMEKLDLHSVAELTKYAVNEGLTSLEF